MSGSQWIIEEPAKYDPTDYFPPVVISTSISTGTKDVSSGPTELSIEFSECMLDNSWSIVAFAVNSLPDFVSQPKFESDGRKLVVSMLLDASRTYAFWLNTDEHHNFKDVGGRPLVPYLIGFTTKA